MGLFCCRGILLAHVQLAAHQDMQVIFIRAAPWPASPYSLLLPEVIHSQVQDFAFVLFAFCKPWCIPQPALVSLNGHPYQQLKYWTPSLMPSENLWTLHHPSIGIDKVIKQDWTYGRRYPWSLLSPSCRATPIKHYPASSIIQSAFYPSRS